MELFAFEPATAEGEQRELTGPVPTGARTHMGIFRRSVDIHVKTDQLTAQYSEKVEEIFGVINAKMQDSSGKIKVDRVTVKLGVEAGGKIGWFVEGRLDVALAFEVEFKVSG